MKHRQVTDLYERYGLVRYEGEFWIATGNNNMGYLEISKVKPNDDKDIPGSFGPVVWATKYVPSEDVQWVKL